MERFLHTLRNWTLATEKPIRLRDVFFTPDSRRGSQRFDWSPMEEFEPTKRSLYRLLTVLKVPLSSTYLFFAGLGSGLTTVSLLSGEFNQAGQIGQITLDGLTKVGASILALEYAQRFCLPDRLK